MTPVEREVRGKVGLISFSNPKKKNALSTELIGALVQSFQDFEKQRIPVIVLRAVAGSDTWSSGIDIAELPRSRRDPLGYFDPIERALRAVQEYPGPVIAMVHGGVWGAACDLVVTCDIVVGDETSTYAITPARIGVPYNVTGILHFMNRVGLNDAKEMFFTADPIKAKQAEHIGIINHLVPSERLEEFTLELAERIASNSPLAISIIKEQFRILSSAHSISPEAFERIQGLRRRVYDSRDYEEGIRAFLEKRAPKFVGD